MTTMIVPSCGLRDALVVWIVEFVDVMVRQSGRSQPSRFSGRVLEVDAARPTNHVQRRQAPASLLRCH